MGKTDIILTIVFFNLVLFSLLGSIIIFIWQYKLKKKLHENKLKELNEMHREELLKNEYEIQQEIMKGIGREIHDNVGQKLTLATLFLHGLPREDLSKEVISKITETTDIIQESLEELRHLSKTLTDNRIENLEISELIQAELDKIKNVQTVKLHSNLDHTIFIPVYQIKAVILRITQEFIQNSLKHSQCQNLYIELQKNNDDIYLRLKDDGVGFNIKKLKTKGIGIENIRKRSQIIKAKLRFKSITNKGTILELKIPNYEE